MNKEKIYVIGHKHPDTDSICSAIAYANLRKKVTGKNYVPARAGEINSETAFVLDRFHTEVPGYMGDVRTQVRDVEVAPAYNGHPEMSIREAWASLQEKQISTLTIVDDKDKLVGLITKGDIAKTYMAFMTAGCYRKIKHRTKISARRWTAKCSLVIRRVLLKKERF